MARKRVAPAPTGATVLVVDDSDDYLRASQKLIEREGHEVLTAESGAAALGILAQREVDLVLVDYLMPAMSGESFVRELRRFRPTTQVILQTGYASENPPREMLRRLDIQGFHDKSDGAEKLALWVDVGLKAARSVRQLADSRAGLRLVLDATPALHRIQPIDDLLEGVLRGAAALLAEPGPLGPEDEGFVALAQDDGELTLRAVTGRFEAGTRLESALGPERSASARAAIAAGCVAVGRGTHAPLRVGTRTLGLLYLGREAEGRRELVELFANQAAVSIHNVMLYEMAALDPLTGVFTRRFFEQAMAREIRSASRTGAPLGLLVVDVDEMKAINDTHGHAAGDAALSALGACLRHSVRASDLVGRIGGDELSVVLPATDPKGVALVTERLRAILATLTIRHEGEDIAVRASLGAAVLASGVVNATEERQGLRGLLERSSHDLYRAADRAMYASKGLARGTPPVVIDWSRT